MQVGRVFHAGLLALLLSLASMTLATDALNPPTLSDLVTKYLASRNADTADDLLTEILTRPDATVSAVQALLSSRPAYGKEPVGTQPSLELRSQKVGHYGLYVPTNYSPDTAYGLVICLHGAGFTGDNYLERWQSRLGDKYILACPTDRDGAWWTRHAEDLVIATLQDVQSRYHVDPNRVFLTGMSNGGIGAYLIGAHHATRFAAVVPMAAGLDNVLMPFLENFRQTPLYIIHGTEDHVMPVDLSRASVGELERLGYPYVYREHHHVHPQAGGHFFPREELPALIAWLDHQRREPNPKQLTVVRDASHLDPFGWIRIDGTERIARFTEALIDHKDKFITNRIYAKLEAEIVDGNRIEVRTHHIRRYMVYLNDRLVNFSRPITITTNGVLSYEGMVTSSPRIMLKEARLRHDPETVYTASVAIDVVSFEK